ncbi:condensation domain-containing protein, partial [Pseudoalteromonas piscicida]|uniref:condensation domain-containing protein n=1 Tax=Pseudoalteromonas piscicida TaxID=43662 RepID=UPI001EFE8323
MLAGVDSALVIAQMQGDSKQLVGYVKPTEKVKEEVVGDYVNRIKTTLRKTLPEYMVPGVILLVTEWPLTSNGKVDKKALPRGEERGQQVAYHGAQSEVEKTLVEIWSHLLDLEASTVSIKANFFDLGGHSLLSIRVVSEVRSRCGVEISLASVFDNATIEELAQVITDATAFSLKVLTQVFETILDRHEVLRSVYEAEGGEARQRVREVSALDFSIKEEDLSHLTGEKLAGEIESRVTADIKQAFNLAEDVMLRVCYIKTGGESGVLIFNMHHIASDGWSVDVLTKEFFALYHAYSAGKANPLPGLPIQYIDYAHWQREYLSGEVLEGQLGYWEEKLAELPVVHSVPLDYARPATKGYEGGVVAGALGGEVSQGLEALASKFRLTPFMLLHGALCLLLSRHSNSQDIVIGTPVANRLHGELEPLIGFFVNTLVLRVDTTARALSAYLEDIRAVHLGAQSNQDVPFEQLVERMKVPRSSAHSPLFQIMMT